MSAEARGREVGRAKAGGGGEGGGAGCAGVDTYKVSFDEGCFSPLRVSTPEEREARKLKSFRVSLSEDQEVAYDAIRAWMNQGRRGSDLLTLGGYAGSGKSTLISLLASECATLRIAFVALTGKAANVLRKKMRDLGLASPNHVVMTLHSLLYSCFTTPDGRLRWSLKKRESFGMFDLIVIDEASMVSAKILEDLEQFGVRILAVGDHGQLPPVGGAGTLMHKPMLRLERIHRQAEGNPILELSRIVRETGDLPLSPPGGHSELVRYLAKRDLPELTKMLLREHAYDLSELAYLAWRNQTRVEVNGVVRELMKRRKAPEVGDQVLCLKNAYRLAFNGMRGYVRELFETSSPHYYEGRIEFPDDNLAYEGSFSSQFFDRPKMPESLEELEADGLFVEDWEELGLVADFGYCMTVHKAQGSQFDTVVYLREKVSSASRDQVKRHIYTGITRAQRRLIVLV